MATTPREVYGRALERARERLEHADSLATVCCKVEQVMAAYMAQTERDEIRPRPNGKRRP